MATLQARTTLAKGASATVATDGSKDIVINVLQGEASVEAVIDSAQTDGYQFVNKGGAVVVVAAYSLVVTSRVPEDLIFEVYAA